MILEKFYIGNWKNIMNSNNSKPRIFCFTHAGGTTHFFDKIEKVLPDYELVKLEYAGHGTRYKEPFYENFDELAIDLFDQIKERINENYSLFGYSMGSISAIEVLKHITDEKLPLPNHVFLSAHEPHTKLELIDYTDNELDEWVKRRTIAFGAVPEELLNNNVFWRTYLPVYRADYAIIARYKFEELNMKFSIPATVFYSEKDTPLTEMKLWRNIFVGKVDFHRFEGNHFFITDHYKELGQFIKESVM